MPWKIAKRRLGIAGGRKQRMARQSEWDRLYGEGYWTIGYVIDGEFISQDDAYERIYIKSYERHFQTHPQDLEELILTARRLRNPHAEATTSVDLQVPAIMHILKEQQRHLQGSEMVDIGSWKGEASHPISIRLSPLQIKALNEPKLTLEKFWQQKKCLAIWKPDEDIVHENSL